MESKQVILKETTFLYPTIFQSTICEIRIKSSTQRHTTTYSLKDIFLIITSIPNFLIFKLKKKTISNTSIQCYEQINTVLLFLTIGSVHFISLFQCVLSHSVVSDSLQSHGLQPTSLLCPRGCSRQEYCNGLPCPPSSRGSSLPRDQTQVSHIGSGFFTI